MISTQPVRTAIDAAWISPGALALFGVPVQNMILLAALVFGIARALDAILSFYRNLKYGRSKPEGS